VAGALDEMGTFATDKTLVSSGQCGRCCTMAGSQMTSLTMHITPLSEHLLSCTRSAQSVVGLFRTGRIQHQMSSILCADHGTTGGSAKRQGVADCFGDQTPPMPWSMRLGILVCTPVRRWDELPGF
jgi:hypothetical protein